MSANIRFDWSMC